MTNFNHVAGFDDAPFPRAHRGAVLLVGTVFSGRRLDGVLAGRVWRDGINSTRELARLIGQSRFAPQLQAILLQGIAFAGFNVVDIHALHAQLGIPVLVVMRRRPDFAKIREALLTRVPGGARKWRLIEQAGPVEAVERVFVQRAGLGLAQARAIVRKHAYHGNLPEPLRCAHLIAGGIARGESRHRA